MKTNTRVYGNAKNFAIVTERPKSKNWSRFTGVLHLWQMESLSLYFTRNRMSEVKEVLDSWGIDEKPSYDIKSIEPKAKEFLSFIEGSF